ncbi:hypothetical protein BACCAP_04140 [Pseudoflavonifractor capillosus ATCC 29799]|uniref:Uncharacterized protein n=1 Tax=Pseudoflavonifractor capillosus ATCC 29799 TaxID=411467 RepID=A6P0X4_9FIRM|nr:hypothetical protein BACCAP_04140 [Pseudoflavonifractor capillosus ATCC 29799]
MYLFLVLRGVLALLNGGHITCLTVILNGPNAPGSDC